MPVIVEEAIVLARYPYRERSAVVALLTRGHGLVRALVRRAQGRAGVPAALEPLASVRVRLFVSPRRELATADELSLLRSWQLLASRPEAWAAAMVAAELALELCPPGTVQEGFYRLLEKIPAWLSAGCDPFHAVLYAKLWALKFAGELPDPFFCHHCGQSLLGKAAYFSYDSGFACATHGQGGTAMGEEGMSFVHQALRRPLDAVRAAADEKVAAVLAGLCGRLLEKELRSEAVFRSLRQAGAGGLVDSETR